MAKIQPVWALDIGQAALKALKLVPSDSPDEFEAAAFDYVEHPKILSQPDADPEALIREALATFMDRNDLKGCKVAIGVPGQAGLVKFIKLPPVEKKRIPDIVKFEAKQQIPFALEEVVWSYQQIGADDEEEGGDDDFAMAEVGLFAMKRDQINRAILPFRAAGIEVDIVQMGPIALYNFIAADKLKGAESNGSVVLIDIGADHTDLIITDGTRIWQRNVPIGGNHFTRSLTKELKLTFAKAEHLKRNATKAPDPKAVFTAMRGVFNDFASEVNRSIGFYTSVNKTSKIAKVIGLGNGFKLPGLQKFLQQNLNGLEVEKLDGFSRLVGEEVVGQPQFVENLPSFAVAYGLALQGLGKSPLRTNLLPPEIEQVRMIRAKKPWILAASALLMLGFTALYLSDYKAYAEVNSQGFKDAVSSAESASKRGAEFQSAFDTAKNEYDAQHKLGTDLVVDESERAKWPAFLKLISGYFPDPVAQYRLDPKNPKDVPTIEKLRVHIDRILPVYTDNVATAWFDTIPEQFKNMMHPYDRTTAPTGKGWIIQIIGHHYNPIPTAEELKQTPRTSFGPRNYLQDKVLPGLEVAALRAKGVHHVALTWMVIDKNWTSAMGAAGSGMASLSGFLERSTGPTVAAADGTGGGAPGGPGGGGGGGGLIGMAGKGGGGYSGMAGGGGGYPGMAGGGGGYPGMAGGGGGYPGGSATGEPAVKLTKLTRTDFLLQFIWQPPSADNVIEPAAEIDKKLRAAENDAKNAGAIKVPSEEELVKASEAKSSKKQQEIEKNTAPPVGVPAVPPVAPTPPTTPAPAAVPPK